MVDDESNNLLINITVGGDEIILEAADEARFAAAARHSLDVVQSISDQLGDSNKAHVFLTKYISKFSYCSMLPGDHFPWQSSSEHKQ